VTDFLEKETREERQGLNVDRVPDAELFFVDKVRGQQTSSLLKADWICSWPALAEKQSK
jgi:hypothetical protein